MGLANIDEIVKDFRESGAQISDEEVEDVINLCKKKIEITHQTSDYMKILLPDELKNYYFRKYCYGRAAIQSQF